MCAIPSAMPYKVMVRGELGPRDPRVPTTSPQPRPEPPRLAMMPQRHNINE